MGRLRRLTRTTLELDCYHCGESRSVTASSLAAGVRLGAAGPVDPDLIALPPCSTCQTTSVLNRTRDTHLTGPPHPARQLINRLHARLKAAGQACEGFPAEDEDSPNLAPDLDVIEVLHEEVQ